MKRSVNKKPLEVDEEDPLAEDLSESLVRDRAAGKMIRRVATSIHLSEELVAKLKKVAAKRDIGYQTMLKIIVAEHIDKY